MRLVCGRIRPCAGKAGTRGNPADYAARQAPGNAERAGHDHRSRPAALCVSCEKTGYLKAGVELGKAPLRALDPRQRARFHGLTAQRSAMIQTSRVHMGRCGDMDAIAEHLMDRMVRVKPG